MSTPRPTSRQRQLLLLLAAAILLVAWVWMQNADAPTEPDHNERQTTRSHTEDRSDAGRPSGTPSDQGADDHTDAGSGLAWVDLDRLPPEAADTLELIDAGGPFPERQDGAVFENRERILPDRDRGYYREYTVPTPGEDDRGARRIVTGGSSDGGGGELYWTADHYQSFERIRR